MKKAFTEKQKRAEHSVLLFLLLGYSYLQIKRLIKEISQETPTNPTRIENIFSYHLKKINTLIGLLLLCSCVIGKNQTFLTQPSLGLSEESITSFNKENRTSQQFRCQERGSRQCHSHRDCHKVCKDIFSRATDKTRCLRLPLKLVEKFQTLIDLVKSGDDIQKIDPDVLECLLNIDERPFSRRIGQLNKRDTEAFLTEISLNEKLGDVIESQDDDYLLLTKLFGNLSIQEEDSLQRLAIPINGRSNIFELIMEENNQGAWDWLAEYIEKKCDYSNFCYSEKANQYIPIVFYCRLFLELDSGRLRTVLASDIFESHFSQDIESEKVCGTEGNRECDSRYIDHFEKFCQSYTDETSL